LYSVWLSLNFFAKSLIRSLLAPVIACQNWISVTACAEAANATRAAATSIRRKRDGLYMMDLLLARCA